MTQTYHDIEAVTQLLQEKERDLELSARIGQSLLQQNRFLDEKASHLEELLNQSQDKISQIRHELKQKTDLLHVFIHEDDESSDGVSIEDVENFDPFSCTETCQTKCRTPASVLELLRKRIDNLESENLMLKSDQVSIQSEADTYEEREKKLISECVKQLNTAHSEMLKNREEIDRKTDILHRYQEEKTQLLSQLVDVQKKYNQISVEYEEVMCNLHAAKDCQQELTQEQLTSMLSRYAERRSGKSSDTATNLTNGETKGHRMSKLRWLNRERVKAEQRENELRRQQFQRVKSSTSGVNPDIKIGFPMRGIQPSSRTEEGKTYAHVASTPPDSRKNSQSEDEDFKGNIEGVWMRRSSSGHGLNNGRRSPHRRWTPTPSEMNGQRRNSFTRSENEWNGRNNSAHRHGSAERRNSGRHDNRSKNNSGSNYQSSNVKRYNSLNRLDY